MLITDFGRVEEAGIGHGAADQMVDGSGCSVEPFLDKLFLNPPSGSQTPSLFNTGAVGMRSRTRPECRLEVGLRSSQDLRFSEGRPVDVGDGVARYPARCTDGLPPYFEHRADSGKYWASGVPPLVRGLTLRGARGVTTLREFVASGLAWRPATSRSNR